MYDEENLLPHGGLNSYHGRMAEDITGEMKSSKNESCEKVVAIKIIGIHFLSRSKLHYY